MPERQWRAAARLKVSVDCAESDWRCGPLQAHVERIMVVQPDEEAWRSGRGATGGDAPRPWAAAPRYQPIIRIVI